MSTTAFKGAGTQLKIGTIAEPPVYSTIYELNRIGGFGEESELLEVTHLESVRKEYIGGLPDGVEVPITVNFKSDDATHMALKSAFTLGTAHPFQMIFPPSGGGGTYAFDGVVRRWNFPEIAPNTPVQAEFTIKITGELDFTEGP